MHLIKQVLGLQKDLLLGITLVVDHLIVELAEFFLKGFLGIGDPIRKAVRGFGPLGITTMCDEKS